MITFMLQLRDESRVLGRDRGPDGRYSISLLSNEYELDRVYMSMQGPRSNQPRIRLSDEIATDETVWITGLETTIVDANSLERISDEFLCHSNLTLNPETTTPERYNQSFETPLHGEWRLFTLVPGRTSIRLPESFGIPVKNGTLLDYFTMALNLNGGLPSRKVRMKTRISYRHAAADKAAMRPLFRRSLYVYQQHQQQPSGNPTDASRPQHDHHGEHCADICTEHQVGQTPSSFASLLPEALDVHPGATCCVAIASSDGIVTQFGEANTVHWMVPPGRHRYRTEVTQQMNLPFDTTVHYVTGHLHPFGKFIELVDMSTGQVVFNVSSKDLSDRLGVEEMSQIISEDGIPIRKGTRYELIAEYDNTTDQPIDAMAILYFYALDQPASAPHSKKAAEIVGP
jgi:hypothetical protein